MGFFSYFLFVSVLDNQLPIMKGKLAQYTASGVSPFLHLPKYVICIVIISFALLRFIKLT